MLKVGSASVIDVSGIKISEWIDAVHFPQGVPFVELPPSRTYVPYAPGCGPTNLSTFVVLGENESFFPEQFTIGEQTLVRLDTIEARIEEGFV